MKELTELYAQMGISPAVYAYGEQTVARLRERFEAIDQVAEYNQAKVLAAFRKNRVFILHSYFIILSIFLFRGEGVGVGARTRFRRRFGIC